MRSPFGGGDNLLATLRSLDWARIHTAFGFAAAMGSQLARHSAPGNQNPRMRLQPNQSALPNLQSQMYFSWLLHVLSECSAGFAPRTVLRGEGASGGAGQSTN